MSIHMDNLVYMAVGACIGAVAGFHVRDVRAIREKMDKVDKIVLKREEKGFMRIPAVANAFMIAVLVISVYASFSTQKTNNELKSTQARISRITFCNQAYLAKTIRALNERTTYSGDQATANVELQKAQAGYLQIRLQIPPDAQKTEAALKAYFDRLTKFVMTSEKVSNKQSQYPYPTNTEFSDCVNQENK